jgi:hypothetical protein
VTGYDYASQVDVPGRFDICPMAKGANDAVRGRLNAQTPL